ncbi:hypothetical protein HN604_04165 [archaeon]|jgi:cytochrome c-type biogenesis protein|nr:hypothetical protein [archaeon]MBT6183046.1 hypothetical protein [archaeon]MBT6606374.1 hypothetical protein [archaeon]MBT7251457.1 hypothetical protein [archaeon]MBT7661243.1 hypothetical protein [archaeon]
MEILINYWLSFFAGIIAPLAAVCVLPLYPGFLAYLASIATGNNTSPNPKETGKQIIKFAWIITAGIITSMFTLGLIFSFILKESLTNVIGIISPIAFAILAVVSILLIFDVDFTKFLPKYSIKTGTNPTKTSFLFGLFFGAIVIPCNPASLVILFAISTSTISFINNLINFVLFGIGMATPLLLFSYMSQYKTQKIIKFLTNQKRKINIITGIIMLAIASYYLFSVFKIQELIL